MDPNTNERITLVRGLGLIAAISVIIGNVIGTGVFLKARVMTCNVGSPSWVIVAWIAAGLLSLAGALTYAELTAMKPQAGGEYVFLRDAYGRLSSFLFGWMQMFVAKPGSQAAAGMAFAIGMNDFLDKQLAYGLCSRRTSSGYHARDHDSSDRRDHGHRDLHDTQLCVGKRERSDRDCSYLRQDRS